ncbi:MAG: FAD-dependent oxidoreductase, partial [Clostridia bacterium]|nr:FAD-dependent oxidoreductase [Clostridia bacterium]
MSYTDYDLVIIGGGASGLACAVKLLKSGKNLKICLIDAGERLGKKLASTGNGQGNISNTAMSADRYHGGNVALVDKIACKDPYAGAKLFDCIFCADERGRIYPAGKQASALVDNLLVNLKNRQNLKLITGVTVK